MEGIRHWVNQSSAFATLAAVVLLNLTLIYVLVAPTVASPVQAVTPGVYFYDLGSGETFVGPAHERGPIAAPSGRLGLRAFVFACGDCGDANKRFVGYLERYEGQDPGASAAAGEDSAAVTPLAEMWERGRMVALPAMPPRWELEKSDAGQAIVMSVDTRCPQGQLARPCLPAAPAP